MSASGKDDDGYNRHALGTFGDPACRCVCVFCAFLRRARYVAAGI